MQFQVINTLSCKWRGPLPVVIGDDTILITEKLASAGDLVGIRVLDHSIVAENGCASMLEKGYLKRG